MTIPHHLKVSLQAVLKPFGCTEYKSKAEVITAFQSGIPFEHHLLGQTFLVSKADYSEGDFIKFFFEDDKKACFYRVIANDVKGAV